LCGREFSKDPKNSLKECTVHLPNPNREDIDISKVVGYICSDCYNELKRENRTRERMKRMSQWKKLTEAYICP